MKKIILFIFTIQTLIFANFFTFKPIKITKDIECVIGDFNPILKSNSGFISNACYVDMGDFLVLLDSGATYNFAKELNHFIEKKTHKKIKYVVLTNYHNDRILGASFFKEKNVKIIAAQNMPKTIKEHLSKYDEIFQLLPKNVTKNTKVVMPDILVKNKYEIKGKKKSLFILKPSKGAQSVTDLIAYSPKDGFIFAGNIIFNGRFTSYAKDSNIDEWIKALEFIKGKKAKYVLGGHGFEFDAFSYKTTLEYLKMLKNQVQNAYDKDIDPADLSKNIHTDIYKNIPHYDELHIRNARNYFDQLEWQ